MTSLKRWFLKRLYKESWDNFNWEVDPNLSLREVCLVVFDTETTGLDLKKDEPIALGALKIVDLRIEFSSKFFTYIKPLKTLNSSIKVHGITPKDLDKAPDPKEVINSFLEYAQGSILCGFFIHIDIEMLRKIIKREYQSPFYPPLLDVLNLLAPEERDRGLDEVLKKFKLPSTVHHNALEDAYMTALLLLKLLKDGGYKKVKDLPLIF